MESFVVRIYRRGPEPEHGADPAVLVGLLESADGRRSRAFRNAGQLWSALLDLGPAAPVRVCPGRLRSPQ
jgi:hypothetical protein